MTSRIRSDHAFALDLDALIRTRRTVKSFLPDPIPEGLVEELLETAVYAPNHRLTEPWEFLYLRGEAVRGYAAVRREMAIGALANADEVTRQRAGEAAYRKFADVPGILIVSMLPDPDPETREEDVAACAALTQNFLLLAWARGLGTAWKTYKDSPAMRAYLGLSPEAIVASVVHLGYPAAEVPAGGRKPARNKLRILG